MASPNIRDGINLRNSKLDFANMSSLNPQYIRIYRYGVVARGEVGSKVFYSPNDYLGNAKLIYKFKGRIVRGRRGRRTVEGTAQDQGAISSLEFNLFFPSYIKLQHGDVALDSLGVRFTVVSENLRDQYQHRGQAVLHQVQ